MGVGSLACQSDVWGSVLIKHSCKVSTLEALLKRSPKVICREKANSKSKKFLTLSLDKHLMHQTTEFYLHAVEVFMPAIQFGAYQVNLLSSAVFCYHFVFLFLYQAVFEVKLLTREGFQ